MVRIIVRVIVAPHASAGSKREGNKILKARSCSVAHDYRAAVGIYSTNTCVERTFIEFKLSGFRVEDISVLLSSEEEDSRELGVKGDTKATTAPVTNSAIAYATLSWLIGMGAPALLTVDSIIAIGPIAEAFAHCDGEGRPSPLSEALVNLGIRERDARYCERRVRDGGSLVSVRPDNAESTRLAVRLFEGTGAE